MDYKPKIKTIDGVNYRRGIVPTLNGDLNVEGITVRGLRQALANADPDALVVYMAEQNDGLLIGCIGGAGMDSETHNMVCLFGPEAIGLLHEMGQKEL